MIRIPILVKFCLAHVDVPDIKSDHSGCPLIA